MEKRLLNNDELYNLKNLLDVLLCELLNDKDMEKRNKTLNIESVKDVINLVEFYIDKFVG